MTGAARTARIERQTSESKVVVEVDLDGSGRHDISTGVGFYDHMLTAFARHSLVDLTVQTEGDTHIDAHHTVEDTAIVIGQALRQALGDKAGVRRFGDATVPLDEALVQAVVDVSGRPYCVHTGEPEGQQYVALGGSGVSYLGSLTKHVFETIAFHAHIALHVRVLAGREPHHIVETQFKAFARAFRDAVAIDPRETGVPSTKAEKKPDVVVLDYGSGNLRSAVRAMERAGADVALTSDLDAAMAADGLLVPGVGAYESCMQGLRAIRGERVIARRLSGGRPVLGICVGMQILFERGIEHGVETAGCGEWPGVVERLQAPIVPHMGWNTVQAPSETRLFAGVEDERFYFVHSYGVREWTLETNDRTPESYRPLVTWAETGGDRFVAAVENGPLWATQFHPEKSGDAGAQLLRNWVETL
jgi:glutamine amidotransferase